MNHSCDCADRRLPIILPEETALGIPAYDMPQDEPMQDAAGAELDDVDNSAEAAEPILLGDLWPRDTDSGSDPIGFDADQIKQLYRQLNHHCQLLIEVFALTACNGSHQDTAEQIGSLLCDYQVHCQHAGCRLPCSIFCHERKS